MKQLKFLFIYVVLILSSLSSLKAQFNLTSLIKGQEFFTKNSATNEINTAFISSQNETFKFSYNFTDKRWVISDNAGNEKTVAFYPTNEPNLAYVFAEGLVMGYDEKLNFILKYQQPIYGKPFKSITIASGVDKLELTNQGGLVAKNAAGVVVWGPNFGN
jgi:hypothetical protein